MKPEYFPCRAQIAHEELLRVLFSTDDKALSAWDEWRERFELELTEPGVRELLPLFHVKLKRLSIVDPVRQILIDEYQRVRHANQKAFRQVDVAREDMSASGISTLLIKGMSLMPYFNDDPALRPMADVDLLVEEPVAAQAIDCLIRTGWRPSPALGRVELVSRIVPTLHSWEFFNNGVGLDLHWLPVHRELGDCGTGRIHKRARKVRILDVPVDVPCVEHQLLLCLLHGLRPQVNRRVQWIVDAMMILNGSTGAFDWDYFHECVSSARLTRIVYNMLDYMNRLFALRYPIPDSGAWGLNIPERLEYEALLKREHDRTFGESMSMRLRKHHRNLLHRSARGNGAAAAGSVSSSLRAIRRRYHHRSLSWLHRHPHLDRLITALFPQYARLDAPNWPVAVVPNHQVVAFGSSGQGFLYTAGGWSTPERRHLWSDGWQSRLTFSLQQPVPPHLRVTLRIRPFVRQGAAACSLEVRVNSRPATRLAYLQPPFPASQAIFLDTNTLGPSRPVDIQFIYLNPGKPQDGPSSNDHRLLGMCLEQMVVAPVVAGKPTAPIHFTANEVGCQYLGCGWWDTEADGVWSAMHHSDVFVPLTRGEVLQELLITLIPFVTARDSQVIVVRVSGRYSGIAQVYPEERSAMTTSVTLTESNHEALQSAPFLRIDFHATQLKAPATESDSLDERKLGFRLVSMQARGDSKPR